MKNESSKTKEILFRIKMKGNGIVNFDSEQQKSTLKMQKINHLYDEFNNSSYAKKNFYGDGKYKIKISSMKLKKSIFRKDSVGNTPNLAHNKFLLNQDIGSIERLLRGYMHADKVSIKKSGVFTIIDAEQTCGGVSKMEFFSRNGDKTGSDGATTIYNKESIGDIQYKTIGSINIEKLQFMSCDQVFDRFNFNPDDITLLSTVLKNNIPNFNSEKGFYKLKTSSVDMEEEGIKFSDENVKFLVKELMSRLLTINIKNSNAYAEVESLEYKLVIDPIRDNYSNEDGWEKINSINDVEKMDFEVEEFYIHVDTNLVEEKRLELGKLIAKLEKKKSDEKAAEKKSKENKK